MKPDYIYPDECYAIRGALFEVHKNLGIGFTEDIYQSALEIELNTRGIPYRSQQEFTISYKGIPLDKTFRVDIVCYEKIIIELKAVKSILTEHQAQLINYLRVANFKLGFLVNFNEHPTIDPQQYLNKHHRTF